MMERTRGDRLSIEVVFGDSKRQELVTLSLEPGATVAHAIAGSGLTSLFPEEDIEQCRVGIWGRPVSRERVLRDGDRVEIYRPLTLDPREARRKLAAEGRSLSRPGKPGHPDDQ